MFEETQIGLDCGSNRTLEEIHAAIVGE